MRRLVALRPARSLPAGRSVPPLRDCWKIAASRCIGLSHRHRTCSWRIQERDPAVAACFRSSPVSVCPMAVR
jgi:hypothetical protein